MIRARTIITKCFWGMATNKNCTRMPDITQPTLRVIDRELKMLRSNNIDNVEGLIKMIKLNDRRSSSQLLCNNFGTL